MLVIPDGGAASGEGASGEGASSGSGSAASTGPSPEVLGLAAFLAAAVGLVSLRILTGRRRRPKPAEALVRATANVPSSAGDWTNVRLDDNDALPSWLRAIAEPERAPMGSTAPIFALEPSESNAPVLPIDPAHKPSHRARLAQAFAQPVEPGAMRLAVTAAQADLLDQPSDLGVTLTNLIAGDEVEIQDLEEPWVRVVTPLGSTGWLRTTSLGVGGAPRAPRPAT